MLKAQSNSSSASSSSEQEASAPLNVTESAARKVWSIIEEDGNLSLKLRISIQGGGCSGFKYHFSLDEDVQERDITIEKGFQLESGKMNAIHVLVDSFSLNYLMGAEVDYVEDIEGARFVIRNPNANTTCGCGSSFSA